MNIFSLFKSQPKEPETVWRNSKCIYWCNQYDAKFTDRQCDAIRSAVMAKKHGLSHSADSTEKPKF